MMDELRFIKWKLELADQEYNGWHELIGV